MSKHLNKKYWFEKDVEVVIAGMLRAGVLSAALVCLSAGLCYLFSQGKEPQPSHSIYTGQPESLRSIAGIFAGLRDMQVLSLMQLGIILLIATPILRILFSLFAFLLEKDYLYAVISTIVLGIIVVSMG